MVDIALSHSLDVSMLSLRELQEKKEANKQRLAEKRREAEHEVKKN